MRLADARDLQAAGDVPGALAKVESGLVQYPNEGRLAQLQTTLQGSMREARRQQDRAGDVASLRGIVPKAGQATPVERNAYLEQARALSQKHPDDPEIGSLAAELRQSVNASATNAAGDASIFSPPTEMAASTVVRIPPSAGGKGNGAPVLAAEEPELKTPPPAAAPVVPPPAPPKPQARPGFSRFQLAVCGVLLLVIAAAVLVSSLRRKPSVKPQAAIPAATQKSQSRFTLSPRMPR